MRRLETAFVLLLTASLLVAGSLACAQDEITKDRIPDDIPAELRTAIEKLYSSGIGVRALMFSLR